MKKALLTYVLLFVTIGSFLPAYGSWPHGGGGSSGGDSNNSSNNGSSSSHSSGGSCTIL